jgi:hypothetical protein
MIERRVGVIITVFVERWKNLNNDGIIRLRSVTCAYGLVNLVGLKWDSGNRCGARR